MYYACTPGKICVFPTKHGTWTVEPVGLPSLGHYRTQKEARATATTHARHKGYELCVHRKSGPPRLQCRWTLGA